MFYLIAKAFITRGEKKYMDACEAAADAIWTRGLLKSESLCHGIPSTGYVLLAMYRLSGYRNIWLNRVRKFYKFMFTEEFHEHKNKTKKTDGRYGLFEGKPGQVCFMVDLLKPREATMPLYFDVFK